MTAEQMELFPFGHTEEGGGRDALNLPQPPRTAQGPLTASSTLSDALDPFTEHMHERELAENTCKSFLYDLGLLREYLDQDATLDELSTSQLEGFLHWLRHEREAPCSLRSLDRRITTLKVFFEWLTNARVLPENPAEPLVYHGANSPLPDILSDAQVEALLDVTRSMRDAPEAPDARPHLLITLLLATGIKKAECMRIRLEHLDLSNLKQPSVYIHYEKPRQRFKRRRLALPDDFIPTFEAYMRRYQPQELLLECTGRNLEYMLHSLSELARLNTKLTFEMLRWTSAVRAFKEGMDPERLRRRLGLSRITWRETWETLQALAEGPL
jgi:site-specific recombinase XerD